MSLSASAARVMVTPARNPFDGPAMRPPPGIKPVYTTSSPEQDWFFAMATVFTVISGIFVLIRLYTVLRIIRKVHLTDCLVLIVFVLYLTMIAFARLVITNGGGVHQWNITLRNLEGILLWMHVNEVIYPVCIVLIKVTILLQYLRILAPSRTVSRTLWYGAWATIAANVLFYVPNFFVNIFFCSPREKIWNPVLRNQPIGHCLDQRAIITAVGIFNIISDIIILILPTKVVWELRIPTHKKAKLSALFATGLMACGADISMVFFLFRMTGHNADVSYNCAWMGTSALIDISLGVIVSCSLSLPRFLETAGKDILRSFSRPIASFTGSRPNRSQAARSRTDLQSAAKSAQGQSLSETNLTIDMQDYGHQNHKSGTVFSTINEWEYGTPDGRQSNDKRAVLNHVV